MTCETWWERDKLNSNTTPRFLTFSAGETRMPLILIVKCGRSCLLLFLEPIKINSVLSGFGFHLFMRGLGGVAVRVLTSNL